MKKITSLALAVFMVISMLIVSFTSASAAVGIDFSRTGSIRLEKYETGSNKTKPVDNAGFTAYKVFDLVQNSSASESADEGTFKPTDAFSNVNFSSIKVPNTVSTGNQSSQGYLFTDTDAVEKLIPQLVAVSKNTTGTNFTGEGRGVYTVDGLSLGIYLVVETLVPDGYVATTSAFLATVPYWDPENEDNDNDTGWDYSVDACPKDDPVDINKVIDNGIENNKLDSFNIGEEIPYKVTSFIPNYGMSTLSTDDNQQTLTSVITDDQYNSIVYTYADTFSSGLTFKYDSTADFKVSLFSDSTKVLKPAENENVELKKRGEINDESKADYKLTKTNNGFKLEVAWEALDAHQGDKLVLEYKAYLNENALVGAENDNTITLTYTNNPEKGTTDVIEDDADVVTYELHLDKLFNNKSAAETFGAASNTAKSVKFKISKNANDSYIPVKAVADGSYVVWDDKEVTTTEMNVDASGKLVLKGLKDGTYYLEEIETVSGYGKLKSKVKIVVNESTADGKKIVDCNAQSYTSQGAVVSHRKFEQKDGTFVVTINNIKNQFTLPQTGGIGLWIFTIAGGAVMAGAIIFFAVIRKKKEQ